MNRNTKDGEYLPDIELLRCSIANEKQLPLYYSIIPYQINIYNYFGCLSTNIIGDGEQLYLLASSMGNTILGRKLSR